MSFRYHLVFGVYSESKPSPTKIPLKNSCLLATQDTMTNFHSPVLCFYTSDNYIIELCLAYWCQNQEGKWCHSLAQLKVQTGKNRAELTSLINSHCSAYLLSARCEQCARPVQVTNRAEFDSAKRKTKTIKQQYCRQCTNNETAKSAGLHDPSRDQPPELFPEQIHSISSSDQLNYTNAVLLYSLLSAAGEQWNNNTIAPIKAQVGALAPTSELTTEIYLHLVNEGIISPSLPRHSSTFSTIGDNDYITFLPDEVTWIVAFDKLKTQPETLMNSLERIIEKFDPAAATALWFVVAEAECERYFNELCERYRFKSQMLYTEKVSRAIRYCLDRLSLPQVWNILWCTMRTIAALVQEGTYSHPHVYNMIPTIVMRDIDRRMANNQQIRPWGRLQPHKEAAITSVLFDKVFGAGTAAFEQVTGKNSSSYRHPSGSS